MPKPKPKHPERDRAMVDITPELRDRLAELAARNYRTVRADGIADSVGADADAGAINEWQIMFCMAREIRGAIIDSIKAREIADHVWRHSEYVNENYSYEDFVVQFCNMWKKVRVLPGEDLLGNAAKMAQVEAFGVCKEHKEDINPGFERFISFCIHVCIGAKSDQIKLPCRQVGIALGINKETVSVHRQEAIRLGYLVPLRSHRPPGAGGRGEATLFRFRVDWWKDLKSRVPYSGPTKT